MNLLFVTFDQWRFDAWSGGGCTAIETPNLDWLAARSVTFTNHFTQATPCGPARACLHTGLHAFNHRSITNGTPLDSRHANWARILRNHGHDPVLFGYTDTSVDPRGLDTNDPRLRTYEGCLDGLRPIVQLSEDMQPWLSHLSSQGYGDLSVQEVYATGLEEPARFSAKDSETAFITHRFLDWLTECDTSQWCAHLSFIKPHPPFVATSPFDQLAKTDLIPKANTAEAAAENAANHPFLATLFDKPFAASEQRRLGQSPRDLNQQTIQRIRQIYLGLIAELDHHLGQILARLSADGVLDQTVIVLCADHGEMLGDHGFIGKSGPYAQAFHVPLIIHDPRCPQTAGSRVRDFTGHIDLMPTILEAMGIDPPLQCDGQSLMPWLHGSQDKVDVRNGLFIEHHFGDLQNGYFEQRLGLDFRDCGYALWLTHDWALVLFQALPAMLFDRKNDPDWLANQFGARSEVAAHLLSDMAVYRQRHADWRLAACQLTPSGPIGSFDSISGSVVNLDQPG